MDLIIGRRVLKNGLVLATTLITCTALQANDQQGGSQQNAGAPQSSATGAGTSSDRSGGLGSPGAAGSDRSSGLGSSTQNRGGGQQQQEQFVKKAMKSNRMEIQMGQLAQQKGQNQQVKQLGQTLVQDHTQANQQLKQIAQSLNITPDQNADHGQHEDKHEKMQQQMSKLQNQSGAEFDKEFVKMALKHHKKDIQEFEQAQQNIQNDQLKSFIQQTLPKLRQHHQMAQAAARTVGVDESSIASDDSDTSIGTGAPAAGQSGSNLPSNSSTESKPRSSIDDGSSISGDARLGDAEISSDVNADVDTSDNTAAVDVDADTDTDGKLFQKGDGKVLGLPTDKSDGKILGILPAPGGKDKDADVDTDNNDASIGGAATSETGRATDREIEVEVDADKR